MRASRPELGSVKRFKQNAKWCMHIQKTKKLQRKNITKVLHGPNTYKLIKYSWETSPVCKQPFFNFKFPSFYKKNKLKEKKKKKTSQWRV